MRDEDTELKERSGVSRREFLKLSGVSVAVPMVVGPKIVEVAGAEVPVHGPGKVPMAFTVNGKNYKAELEPRVTLLDALRDQFDLTGSKRVCDRGECGSCTVLMDGKPVYACNILAIEAQGRAITTIEGVGTPEKLHPIQQAFVENDASQCGFCTPGFIMASKALLDKYPNPTPEQIRKALGGNFCRCGTYVGIRSAWASLAHGRKGA